MTDRSKDHLHEREAQQYASTRLWNAQPNKLGMAGEKALADFFCADPDLRNRPGGDDGIDIEVLLKWNEQPEWFEVDVKTANGPKYLLVNRTKIQPQRIYVLAGAANVGARLLKWEWGRVMQQAPVEAWAGNDALVHYKAHWLLRPLDDLKAAYAGWWRHHGLEPQRAKIVTVSSQPVNPFCGSCACGRPGMFVNTLVTPWKWQCSEHRTV